MKVIIIHDALVKTVINAYMVNDDVTMPPGCEENLLGAGYTYQVLHPIPMNQNDLNAEVEDYCNSDCDMGKATHFKCSQCHEFRACRIVDFGHGLSLPCCSDCT